VTTLYFETSAFVKLLVAEAGSRTAVRAWDSGYPLTASGLLFVEARASLAAAHRGGRMTGRVFATAKRDLALLREHVNEINADPLVLARAEELAELEALRGYDAVHLASALYATAEVLVTADVALIEAARRQGLSVVDART
jgi:predicted nucleic acid-binding protein